MHEIYISLGVFTFFAISGLLFRLIAGPKETLKPQWLPLGISWSMLLLILFGYALRAVLPQQEHIFNAIVLNAFVWNVGFLLWAWDRINGTLFPRSRLFILFTASVWALISPLFSLNEISRVLPVFSLITLAVIHSIASSYQFRKVQGISTRVRILFYILGFTLLLRPLSLFIGWGLLVFPTLYLLVFSSLSILLFLIEDFSGISLKDLKEADWNGRFYWLIGLDGSGSMIDIPEGMSKSLMSHLLHIRPQLTEFIDNAPQGGRFQDQDLSGDLFLLKMLVVFYYLSQNPTVMLSMKVNHALPDS